ncbi:MAG: hypothetical protein EXS49_01975 [Candidatus Pacebacteria bacterium]|nr:hypothetical protein [Candidatus Paceibacterota bacterium]
MIKITQQEVGSRWRELSLILRESLFSEENSNIVFQISGAKKLNEKIIDQILLTAGDVLMGFVPLDTVKIADELAERTGIDKQIAYEISQELNRKIFEPLKTEIEDIGVGASIIYNKESQTIPTSRTTNEFKSSQNPNAGQAPVYRGQAMQNLENRLSGYNQESRPRDFVNELTNDKNRRMGEVSGNNGTSPKIQKIEEIPDAPFIMHEEKPIFTKEQTGFRKNDFNSPMSYQPFKLQDVKSQKEAPVSARIDLGQEEPSKTSSLGEENKDDSIRVVHYSEFKTIPKK